jgi:hypothetical protein
VSVERILRWKCDRPGCDRQVLKSGFGLPDGWTWEASGVMGVVHSCRECVAGQPPLKRLTDAETERVLGSVTCAGIAAPGDHPGWKMRQDWLRAREAES